MNKTSFLFIPHPSSLLFFLARAAVKLVNQTAILFINHAPLDLERGRHLAAINGELFRQERDAPDALVVGERGGQRRDLALDETNNFGVAAQSGARVFTFLLALCRACAAVLCERRFERLPGRHDRRGGRLSPP